jgi:Protein of unknown function (DUF3485)
MTRYVPILAGTLLLVGLTIVQIRMTDRFEGTNVTAEQRAELLKLVPMNIGDWQGEDMAINEDVKKTAGAVGAVSRSYRNSRTGERVDVWLIVGHSRDVSVHTPDICYPGSGFEARAKENGKYPFQIGNGEPDATFFTNTFYKEDVTGRTLRRVFWTWYNPETDEHQGNTVWEAPNSPKRYFGNTRGLFKLYFTSEMRDPMETAEQSAALHLARDFLPVVNKALGTVIHEPGSATAAAAPPASSTPETSATTTEAKEPSAIDATLAPVTDAAKEGSTPPNDVGTPATPPAEPSSK